MRFHLKWVSPSRPYPPAIPDLQGLNPSTCSVQKNSLVQIAAQRALWRGWGGEGDTHLRLYTEVKALLRRELDVEPSAETEATIAGVRNDRVCRPGFSMPAGTRLPASPGCHAPPRIAVLPLRQFLDKALPSHISDGITADIISQLAGLRELAVISHGSTFDLRDPGLDPRQIGRKLDIHYFVVGNIRRVGDQ